MPSDRLPAATVRYVETACHAEMRALGYATSSADCHPANLESTGHKLSSIHDAFSADYSTDEKRLMAEGNRIISLLAESPLEDEKEIRRRFIYPEAYVQLRAAMKAQGKT